MAWGFAIGVQELQGSLALHERLKCDIPSSGLKNNSLKGKIFFPPLLRCPCFIQFGLCIVLTQNTFSIEAHKRKN